MKSAAKFIAGLALTALIGACAEHKPPAAKVSSTAVKPQPQAQTQIERQIYFIPPPKLPGEWTVEDILQTYSADVAGKLNDYFAKAKVSYPPRQVTLIALKQEKKLELWARDSGEFRFIRDYYIIGASGTFGPKLRQGDKQVPEGVYRITELNPNSRYHLSMKINYPNEFDLYHARREGRRNPGSDIFIHGNSGSIGCLAMGDKAIEELFVLTALTGAENVSVVIAPHDPRLYPLEADYEDLPEWTAELYALISGEIQALSPTTVKPAKTGF